MHRPTTPEPTGTDDELVSRFVAVACPDHHIRGARHHVDAHREAMTLLAATPALREAGPVAAVVTGQRERLAAMLAADPSLATARLGPKDWTLLLYLCFTRLDLPETASEAVPMAELLLGHGADPNAFFPAGDCRYTPLVGAVGEGEEDRPPHPARDALVECLLSHDAEPYDIQVFYNLHFRGPMLWWLQRVHAHSLRRGRAADWADGAWRMIEIGPYGVGARWHFDRAILRGDTAMVTWMLEHGASPHVPPATDHRFPKGTVLDHAIELGRLEIAALLEARGGRRTDPAARGLDARDARLSEFTAAVMRLDRAAAESLLRDDPSLRTRLRPLMLAAEFDRTDVLALLLDLGWSPDAADHARGQQRPLHVAAYAGAARAVALLLARGASPDPRDAAYDATPLGFAAYAQQHAVIERLVPVSRDEATLRWLGATARLREIGARGN